MRQKSKNLFKMTLFGIFCFLSRRIKLKLGMRLDIHTGHHNDTFLDTFLYYRKGFFDCRNRTALLTKIERVPKWENLNDSENDLV